MSTSQFGTATASHLLPSISTFLQTPHELSTVSHTTNAGVDINSLTYGPDKKLTAVTLDLPDGNCQLICTATTLDRADGQYCSAGGQIKSQSWLTSCPAPPHKNIEQIIQQTRTISESVSSLKGCTVVDPATWLNNMTKNARVLLYSLNELYSDHTDSNCTTRINSRLDYDLIWRRRVSKGRFGKTRARKRSICTPQLRCHSCNVTETPEWRRGPDGARTLCNACGLHYAKLTKGNNLKVNPKSNVQLSPSASISKRDAPSTQC